MEAFSLFAYFTAVALALALGVTVGRMLAVASLLIGAERDDRTPHKMGYKFYYLVPEREYCELCRLRYQRQAADDE